MRRVVTMMVLLLGLQGATGAPAQSARQIQAWNAQLRSIDAMLVERQGEQAYLEASRLSRDLVKRATQGQEVQQILATTWVLRALGAVQSGAEDEAVWHWQIVRQVFPRVGELTMAAYGRAGPFLRAQRIRDVDSVALENMFRGAFPPAAEVTRKPVKIRTPVPDFRRTKLGQRSGPRVLVNVRIGEDGSLSDPWLLEFSGESVQVLAVLDALRDWRFEPAEADGEAVAVYLNLTLDLGAGNG